MSAVYVVSFAPADDQGGVGGFWWWPARDHRAAVRGYVEAVRESAAEVREGRAGHVVRLVEVEPDWGPSTDEQLTHEIEAAHLEGVEDDYVALRQYVPPTTIPEHIPTGRINRHTFPEEIQP